ncbi:scabin-related ADP-ribosyltransferase [Streptomyces globisporus]
MTIRFTHARITICALLTLMALLITTVDAIAYQQEKTLSRNLAAQTGDRGKAPRPAESQKAMTLAERRSQVENDPNKAGDPPRRSQNIKKPTGRNGHAKSSAWTYGAWVTLTEVLDSSGKLLAEASSKGTEPIQKGTYVPEHGETYTFREHVQSHRVDAPWDNDDGPQLVRTQIRWGCYVNGEFNVAPGDLPDSKYMEADPVAVMAPSVVTDDVAIIEHKITFDENMCAEEIRRNESLPVPDSYFFPTAFMISTHEEDVPDGGYPSEPGGTGSVRGYALSEVPNNQTYGSKCQKNLAAVSRCTGQNGVGVNTATGAFSQEVTDIQAPGFGSPQLHRTYSSNNTTSGALGTGWASSWDARLIVADDGNVILQSEDGSKYPFTRNADGTFTGPASANATLLKTSSGYKIQSPLNETIDFDSSGLLKNRKDAQGLITSYEHESSRLKKVIGPFGGSASLAYEGGLLTSVKTSDGRGVTYGYEGGRLASFKNTDGSTVKYEYDANHRLFGIVDQMDNPVVRTYYDAQDRVIEQRVGPDSVKSTFAYRKGETDYIGPSGGVWTDIYAKNVLVAQYDPLGNKTSFEYTYQLDPVGVTDARGHRYGTGWDPNGRLVKRTSPESSEEWNYNSRGDLISWNKGSSLSFYEYDPTTRRLMTSRDASWKPTKYTYKPSGLLESVTLPSERRASYEYDELGNISSFKDGSGNALTRTYDAAGNAKTVTDPRGNLEDANPADFTSLYEYDASGRILRKEDPHGNATTNKYDAAGNLKTSTDSANRTTSYTYDTLNRLTEVNYPDGSLSKVSYDAAGRVDSRTDRNQEKTTYGYDKADRLTSITTPRGNITGANPASFTWKYGYDEVGNQTTVTDPAGKTSRTDYDAENRPIKTTDQLNRTTATSYNREGNVASTTDALMKETTNSYDENGRLKSVEDRDGKAHLYDYDDDGNLTSETTPLGHKTTYLYDDSGRLTGRVDPRGNVAGANPGEYTWHTEYDAAGNVIGEKDPLGHKATSTYDALNNLRESADRRGKKTTFEYDSLQRLKKITAPDTGTTLLDYNASGLVSTRTDSNQHATTYEYDKVGRQTKITDPLKRATSYEYDPDGNRKKVTNARGQTIVTTYDGRGFPETITSSDGTPKITYTYYDDGMPKTIADGTGTRTLTYDPVRRPLSITQPGVAQPFKYSYRAGGAISSRTYPNGRATTFLHDDDGRIKSQTTNGKTTTYTWDPANNLTTTKFPTTTARTETRTYDRAGRIDSASEGTGMRNFTRDPNGRVISDTYKDQTTTRPTTRYAYDDTGRLTRTCTDTTTSCLAGTAGEAYSYDKVGNRTTTVTAAGTTIDSHDAANQLTSRVAGTTTTKMTYDADGNLTKDASGTYAYTAGGQIKTATVGANTYTFGYDSDGNRTTAAVNGTASRITTWDVNNPLPQIATDRSAANVLVGDYQYNPLGIAQQMDSPKGSFYLQHDRQGSATNVYDAAGKENYKYTYGSWGATTGTASIPGGQVSLFGYTGQYKNPYIPNQLDLRARTYSSAIGRFTTTDPEPTEPGDPNSSPYAYANNDPVNQSDPSGRCPLCVSAGIGALIGGAIEGGIYGWQHRNDANFSWQGLAGATARGAVTGAVAGALMPGVGNAATRGLGLSGLRGVGASAAVNAGVGAGFAWGVNQVHCRPTGPWDLIFGASGGAASSLIGPAFNWLRGLRGKTPATNPFPHISAPAKAIVFPKRVFRGDSRNPDEVFANGFKAEPMEAPFDLQQYGWYNTGSASVVGTSKKANLAMQFPQKAKGSTWVYEIAHPGAGIDMNKALGMNYVFSSEKEIIFPGGILPSQIVRAVRWSWGMPTKQVVENPGYSP